MFCFQKNGNQLIETILTELTPAHVEFAEFLTSSMHSSQLLDSVPKIQKVLAFYPLFTKVSLNPSKYTIYNVDYLIKRFTTYQVKTLSERYSSETWPKTGTSLTRHSSSSWQSLRSRISIFPISPSSVSFLVSSWIPLWVKFDPVIFTALTVQILKHHIVYQWRNLFTISDATFEKRDKYGGSLLKNIMLLGSIPHVQKG